MDVEYAHKGENDTTSLEIERYHIQPSVQTEMISDYVNFYFFISRDDSSNKFFLRI